MTENKRFNTFVVDGTIFLEDHKEGSYHIGEMENVDVNCLNDIADRLNELSEENEQLKQENKKLKQSFGNIRNSIRRLYRNGQITFDERAFYLRKLSEIEDGDVE